MSEDIPAYTAAPMTETQFAKIEAALANDPIRSLIDLHILLMAVPHLLAEVRRLRAELADTAGLLAPYTNRALTWTPETGFGLAAASLATTERTITLRLEVTQEARRE